MSLFGSCLFFLHLGKEPKEIPESKVDYGCKFFVRKSENKDSSKMIIKLIETFNGEILPYDKPKKMYSRDRIFKKSKHKYGKRKDWD